MQSNRSVRKGDVLTLTVERAAFEGRSVSRYDNIVIFIDGAVPGDTVKARIYRKKKQFAEARVEELVTPSLDRIEPSCKHFGICGGCKWQNLEYQKQLFWKREHVIEAYERIGGFPALVVRDTLRSKEEFYYRNKMEYSFGGMRWLLPEELERNIKRSEHFVLGLHIPGRYDRILHIDECWLESAESNAILNATREFFISCGLKPYSTKTHTGDLRHLVIREGKHTGERMVFLVSSEDRPDIMSEYTELLKRKEYGVSTFIQGITQRKSTVAIAEREIVHFGSGRIHEQLGDIIYSISPISFFQTNTFQAERLYSVATRYAELKSSDHVWDLYCGTGTIALFISKMVRYVLGVELNPTAIKDAEKNAELNGIQNAEFICADIIDFAQRVKEGLLRKPDVIILDPPRAGLHPDVAKAVGELRTQRLVYVSCNPATSARDCRVLCGYDYVIEEITPVDMFPHTYHIECVVKLRIR